MTQFNPDKKRVLIYGEVLGPAMRITEQDDADQYLNEVVEYTLRIGGHKSREFVEGLVLHNLLYYSKYYEDSVQKKVKELFLKQV